MANIIAIVWDFDKTLIEDYMENPILVDNGIDPKTFWDEVNALPEQYKAKGVKVNPDTIYLNHMINYVKQGKLGRLNNAKLAEYGKRVKFYPGVPDIFQRTKDLIGNDPIYQEHDIKVEHYIVSTGLTAVIRGSEVAKYVKGIWGCEFIEVAGEDGEPIIGEVGYTIDNTTKTRALFEINKGVGITEGITVNTNLPEANRRVHFINMAYVADGPSDIPAFSVINKHGGSTFAVYPAGDIRAMEQVEKMREDGRVNMFAEADYSEGKTASMWLCSKIKKCAERIRQEQQGVMSKFTAGGEVRHLTD